VSIWNAVFWGALSSAALFIGEALAGPLEKSRRKTGLVMGFGAGTLLSAIAYELIPQSSVDKGATIGAAFLIGALAYYFGDFLIDRRGGADRQSIDGGSGGSGAAMFVGALLDGLPEAFVLGISLAVGGSVSVAFVTAVFVSNIPQGVAGTAALKTAGYRDRHIFLMWLALTVSCAAVAALGFQVVDSVPNQGLEVEAFAAGAVLTMLANSMMPEAYEHGGNSVGLLTVLGYLIAAALTIAD
jgi:ZIP family zinc transporter